MCHTCARAIYIKKQLKAKEELWESQIVFHHAQNIIIFQKIFYLKRNQNPSRYYNSIITNLQVSTQAKIIIIQKSSHKNRYSIIIIIIIITT